MQQPTDAELYDHVVDVDGLDVSAQVAAVRDCLVLKTQAERLPDATAEPGTVADRAGLATGRHRGATDGVWLGGESHRMRPRSQERRLVGSARQGSLPLNQAPFLAPRRLPAPGPA